MISRRIAAFAGLLAWLLLGSVPAFAAAAAASPAPATAPAATPAPVSADELQRLVDTLNDDAQRAKLVDQLKALIAAQRGVEQKQQAQSPSGWLNTLSTEVDSISSEILAAAAVVVDAPSLIGWVEVQVSDVHERTRWLAITLKLGIIFGVALVGEWLIRALLRRPRAALAARSSDARLAQLVLLVALLVVDALPVVGFAVIAYFVLPLVQARFTSSHVAEVIIQSNLTARLILVAASVALLSPPSGALYPLGDETRNYLYIWIRRFTNWAVYGLALAAGTWWMGIPGAIYALLLRGTMLVLGILSIIFVLQNRTAVGEILRGKNGGGGQVVEGHGWRMLRHRLADTWHVLAILYIAGTFGTYVLRIEAGFAFVFRATLLSLVVIIAAGIIVRGVRRVSQRGFAIGDDLKRRFPTLEQRANRYVPLLTIAASMVVYVFAALALLQAWGFNTFSWFSTEVGRKITGSVLSIATVLLVALLVWELFGSAVERYLNGLGSDGKPLARSARTRTLLPLLRTSVFIVLLILVGLIVLSELGVNIAPLLAGAGIAGIAIGFGSQALVKDVITGLFILLEDTLSVGDVVDVGSGHSGVVEAISIRAIRLRDGAGTVHTVPFSDVTTVKNMTKGYAYYVADVGVSYREDTDEVTAVLKEVAEELRRDPEFGAMMLEPMEVIGVDRFENSAVVIQVRMKTLPIKQWSVGREFNRRLKKAFDQHGIEMPYPHQTIYFGEDKRGSAPPARIAIERIEMPEAPTAAAEKPIPEGGA
ncbi:MAG TPA: mechanosensitive ion channel domain-containing protein [Stellaceae bacterium]|nr:mechanosensitive ion channel domain-containing protein [Stellaceae bacterium]